MKYKYETDDEIIIYDVSLDKNKLNEIKNIIIEEDLNIKEEYNILINIIVGIIDEQEESLDSLFELELNVSFFKEEIKEVEDKISFIENEIEVNKYDEKQKVILENNLFLDNELLDIYKKIDRRLKQEYYDYSLKVLSCIELKRENTKKKVKKYE